MLESELAFAHLEEVYDLLADGIDQAGEDKAAVFLSKVALGLASQIQDVERIRAVIAASLKDLP